MTAAAAASFASSSSSSSFHPLSSLIYIATLEQRNARFVSTRHCPPCYALFHPPPSRSQGPPLPPPPPHAHRPPPQETGLTVGDDQKPSHSYIGLIAMAILNSRQRKLVLSGIYQWILDHYAYFRSRGPGWRNSIRHNLSLNDCFIKSGRSSNGKGHYWTVHPANLDDFLKGDFRRRRAQRKARRAMGLAVEGDRAEGDQPPPQPSVASQEERSGADETETETDEWKWMFGCGGRQQRPKNKRSEELGEEEGAEEARVRSGVKSGVRKRSFDVESLLAPDETHSTLSEQWSR